MGGQASETAKDRICGLCMEELTEWICTCGTPEEYVLLRGSRSKIRGGVSRFNQVEESLVMELAELDDMLTTPALEAIVGADEGVVVTALDCKGWSGWYGEDTCRQLTEAVGDNGKLEGKPSVHAKLLHEFTVHVAAVEVNRGVMDTVFDIHFRLPDKARPQLIHPAGNKNVDSLRERVFAYGSSQDQK